MEIIHSATYDEYKAQQLKRFYRKRNRVFVLDSHLEVVVSVIQSRWMPPVRGICHGVRTGYEVQWLSGRLNSEIIGTDIGPISGDRLRGDWDFHDQDEAWRNSFCFVYSNALDHSDRPDAALRTWADQLMQRGLLILHWSPTHSKAQNRADCFGATLEEYMDLAGTVTENVRTLSMRRKHALVIGTKA